MTHPQNPNLKPSFAANYNSAVARAVEWLGDRYLLAKPINAAPTGFRRPGTLAGTSSESRRYNPPEIALRQPPGPGTYNSRP
jgi:hypothetical protein